MSSSFDMKNSENVRTNALVHCLAHGGFQPISPDMASFGMYLSTLMALFWTEFMQEIRVITKLPNSEQSYKGKVKTQNYINRQNQSTTGKL